MAAEPPQRGFTYTLLAVLLSAIALVHTNEVIGHVDIDRVLSATSLALIVGTALSVFPMTWRLLQLEEVKTVHESLQPDDSTVAAAAPLPPRAPPRNGPGVAALVLGAASLVAALSFILFPLGLLGGWSRLSSASLPSRAEGRKARRTPDRPSQGSSAAPSRWPSLSCSRCASGPSWRATQTSSPRSETVSPGQ